METHTNLKPWQPGQSGNPNGRQVGSRAAFSAGFTRDLAEVWAEKGKASMLYTADKQPAVFFATCARLLPNDVRVTVEQSLPGNLSPSDWHLMLEVVEAVVGAMPRCPAICWQVLHSSMYWMRCATIQKNVRNTNSSTAQQAKFMNELNGPFDN